MNSLHTLIQRISALIAIFNNALLILLIIFKSHRKVGKYKYLMIYISVFEIVYAILDGCAAPTIFTRGSIYLVVTYSSQMLVPPMFLESFSSLFCVFFGISMAIFAVHFIYRYLVVSENEIAKKYDTQVIFGLLLFPLLFGVFWLWVVRCFITSFGKADRVLSEQHLNIIGVNITEVKYVGPYFWQKENDGNLHANWKSVTGVMIMFSAIVMSFIFILVFGYKCYNETKKLIANTSQSASFNKLQTQLFYALVLQTAIPVVLMHIPASIGFTAAFFNISIEFFGELASLTICLYPTLDPLPNFIIIQTYREAICKPWRFIKRRILHWKGATVGITTAMASEVPSNSVIHSAFPPQNG